VQRARRLLALQGCCDVREPLAVVREGDGAAAYVGVSELLESASPLPGTILDPLANDAIPQDTSDHPHPAQNDTR
jgi:hypothetical protein